MKTTAQTTSLFNIIQNRLSLEEVISELGGELTPDMEKDLQINAEELARKGESYIYILESLLSYQELNKRYLEQAKKNMDRAEKAMTRLKDNLLEAAKTFGEFEAGIHKVGTRKSSQVVIDEPEKLPAEYVTTKVTRVPDKKEIGEALKAGRDVPGAHYQNNLNLKIT